MAGVQTKKDDHEKNSMENSNNANIESELKELKESKQAPVQEKPQETHEIPTKQKRITLPIIYKNKSSADMFKKKSFTVKVNEEKEKIKRQEKPKSPTPEPPPVIKQENKTSGEAKKS